MKWKRYIILTSLSVLIMSLLFFIQFENKENLEDVGSTTGTKDTEEKIIYLTFDDGPTEYTASLLEILDKYGVKVTFFVTNQYPEYQDLIGEAYSRGHTIGLHSYSHNYNIYSSEKAYYEDLELLNEVVIEQTGVPAKIVRFPGGSSNCISWNYCSGIMKCLSEGMKKHGYVYCDWNVDSLDSHGYLSAEEIARTAITGIKKQNISIVLLHDMEKINIDAVEKIICWGLENGYTFCPMSKDMEMIHHKVTN